MNQLKPHMKEETAAQINEKFHATTDSLELMTKLGKQAAKSLDFPVVTLAN